MIELIQIVNYNIDDIAVIPSIYLFEFGWYTMQTRN